MDIFDTVAGMYAKQGKGTGAFSKILSGFTFPILTVLAMQLVKNGQYLALFALYSLMWTRFGSMVLFIGLGYFVYAKLWAEVSILVAYFIFAFASMYLGQKNIRRLLFAGKPMVSPFEGMPDMLVLPVLECLFLALAFWVDGWMEILAWALFAIVSTHHAMRYSSRLFPQWRQVHNSLMIRYAGCAGKESAEASTAGRDFDFSNAIKHLLATVYEYADDEQINEKVETVKYKYNNCADRDLLIRTVREAYPHLSQDTVKDVNDKIDDFFQVEGEKIYPRYAIAEVVEHMFGEGERGKYLLAVSTGKAL